MFSITVKYTQYLLLDNYTTAVIIIHCILYTAVQDT